jgi:hypothetical protein
MKPLPLTIRQIMSIILIVIITPVSVYAQQDSDDFVQITTNEELERYLANLTSHTASFTSSSENYGYRMDDVKGLYAAEMALPSTTGSVESKAVSAPSSESTGVAASYTTTNIQVAGVDEADFVKNDGTYIYIVSGEMLSIVQAYPPQAAEITSQVQLPAPAADLFLAQDRLVIFVNQDGYIQPMNRAEAYRPPIEERTYALIYDISNKNNPELIREISAPGRYENARMIGDYVYFLSADFMRYFNPWMPIIYDKEVSIPVRSVWCPPVISGEYTMNTLTSFPVSGSGAPQGESFLVGRDTTLYVSSTDVFVAYEKNQYGWRQPVMIDEEQSPNSYKTQESVIHRFTISQGTITYKATGIVPGYLLNQFSLDQYEGTLRVATTIQDNSVPQGQTSGVYVLNPDMTIIGEIEGLAPGEKIYSARFMGDMLYLVTFKQTDPLFVIDLSNPYQPGILGELKIPGYSDYLHPYDDTHIIGIGKDTYENEWGGIIPSGVKLALFDVSDINNPQLKDSIVIGEKGSDSAVLSDHRAFLLDKGRNIMALPIKEVVHTPISGSKYEGSYIEEIWQGTYVFDINPETGFTERGRIRQGTDSVRDVWWSGSTVLRALCMDHVIYTISQDTIIGSDLNNLPIRLMKIDFEEQKAIPWYLKPFSSLIE